jgi:hypothetical protein
MVQQLQARHVVADDATAASYETRWEREMRHEPEEMTHCTLDDTKRDYCYQYIEMIPL